MNLPFIGKSKKKGQALIEESIGIFQEIHTRLDEGIKQCETEKQENVEKLARLKAEYEAAVDNLNTKQEGLSLSVVNAQSAQEGLKAFLPQT